MFNRDSLRQILSAQLGAAYPPHSFKDDTPLLGSIAELDSMAVVGILAAIEESSGIAIPDDEVSADVFETFGTLVEFVVRQSKAA